ncbi:GPI-anchored surface protein, putative [Bodo saltans]|uniref:GPI-anchored surface protein, putative n=1 Tax=Bodo saltans TaxID=75058 RepID=A0A0S4KE10_BODSA|nr:GPI-anchored surface protein, putative [Bodo saltans]|eukprot:CUI12360.1 GPI-anchored surface protein, putative [Bodo saltans]
MSGPVDKSKWVIAGTACASCKKSFGVFGAKKKNCPYCGRLLCTECVNAQVTLGQTQDKVCLDCFANIQNSRQTQHKTQLSRPADAPVTPLKPPPPPAESPAPSTPVNSSKSYEARVRAIYARYAPDRMNLVDATLEKYKGSEEALLEALAKKYGPEPSIDIEPSQTQVAPSMIQQRITAMFETYAPAKVSSVDTLMEKYKGSEDALLEALVKKYGPEPSGLTTAAPSGPTTAGPSSSSTPTAPTGTPALTPLQLRIEAMYRSYAPEKLPALEATLAKYKGSEDALLEALVKKYGPEGGSREAPPVTTTTSREAPPTTSQPAAVAEPATQASKEPPAVVQATPSAQAVPQEQAPQRETEKPSSPSGGAQLGSLAAQLSELQERVAHLATQSAVLQEENVSWVKRCDDFNQQVGDLHLRNAALESRAQESSQEAKQTAATLREREQRLQELEKQHASLQTQFSTLQGDAMNSSSAAAASLQSETERLMTREAALTAAIEEHTLSKAALEAEQVRLAADRSAVEAARASLDADVAAFAKSSHDGNSALESSRRELEDARLALARERAALEAEHNEKAAAIAEQQTGLDAREKELKARDAQLAKDLEALASKQRDATALLTETQQGRERVLEEQEAALSKREAELAVALAALSGASDKHSVEAAALTSEQTRLALDRGAVEEARAALDADIAAFHVQAAAHATDRNELENARAALALERTALIAEQSAQSLELAALRAELDSRESELEAQDLHLAQKVAAFQKEYADSVANMTTAQQDRERALEEQEASLSKREAELASAVAALSIATERHAVATSETSAAQLRLAQDRSAFQEARASLDEELKRFREESDTTRVQLEKDKKEIDQSRSAIAEERAELRARSKELDESVAALAEREAALASGLMDLTNQQQTLESSMKAQSAVFEEGSHQLSTEEALKASQLESEARLLTLAAEASQLKEERTRLEALAEQCESRCKSLEDSEAEHKARLATYDAGLADQNAKLGKREDEVRRMELEQKQLQETYLLRESAVAAAEEAHRKAQVLLQSREDKAIALEKSAADKIGALEQKVQGILSDQATIKQRRKELDSQEAQLVVAHQQLDEQRRAVQELQEAHGMTEHRQYELSDKEQKLAELQQVLDKKMSMLVPYFGVLEGGELQHQHPRNRWLQAAATRKALSIHDAYDEVKHADTTTLQNITAATWKTWIAEPWKEGWKLWLQQEQTDAVTDSPRLFASALLEECAIFVADHWCLLDTVVPRGNWQTFVRMITSLSRQVQGANDDAASLEALSSLLWVSHVVGKVYRQLFAAMSSSERLAALVAAIAPAVEQNPPETSHVLDVESISIGSDAHGAAAQRAIIRAVMSVISIPDADITELMDHPSARTFHALLSTLLVQRGDGPKKHFIASCVDLILTLGLPFPSHGSTSTMHVEFVVAACTLWSRPSTPLAAVVLDIAQQTSKSLDTALVHHVTRQLEESGEISHRPANEYGSLLTIEVRKLMSTLASVRTLLGDAEAQRDAARDAVAVELASAKEHNFNAHKMETAAAERLADVAEREAAVATLEVRLVEVQRREQEAAGLYQEAVEIQVRNAYQGVLPAERERLQRAAEVIAARELTAREAASAAHIKSQHADAKLKQVEEAEAQLEQKQNSLILLEERLRGIELREAALERREEAYMRLMASTRHTTAKTLVNGEWEQRLSLRTEEVDAALKFARQTSTKLEKELRQQINRREEISVIQECEENVRKAVELSRERRLHAAQGFTVSRSEHTAHRPIDRLERAVFQLTSTLAACAAPPSGKV